jgi:glycosyltransferase involved in cell wall biosynthesis
VGRLDAGKNVLCALAAFAEITAPHARLVIVGDGEDRAACEAMIRDRRLGERVIMAGRRDDIPDVMRAADLFVLPTEVETFGNALAEAMAARLPIVTSNAPPVAHEVVPADCGLFVPPRDVNAIARALRSLVHDDLLRDKLGDAARRASERLDIATSARNYLALYDAILRAKRLAPLS